MAKLSAHGTELFRYLEIDGRLRSVRSDGTILVRSVYRGWKLRARKKPEIPLEEWIKRKLEARDKVLASEEAWRMQVKSLPSMKTLERWQFDSVCEAVDGCTVEPDGTCPHGTPSWLRALRLI